MSGDPEAEIRASVGAHHDLGSGYSDAVAEGLVERIGAEIDKRIDARIGQLGAPWSPQFGPQPMPPPFGPPLVAPPLQLARPRPAAQKARWRKEPRWSQLRLQRRLR